MRSENIGVAHFLSNVNFALALPFLMRFLSQNLNSGSFEAPLIDSLYVWIIILRIQLKDQFSSLMNPKYLFFSKLSPKSCNEPTKIGYFQNSEPTFDDKYLLNLAENHFLLRIVN